MLNMVIRLRVGHSLMELNRMGKRYFRSGTFSPPCFKAGIPKHARYKYTRTLVITRKKVENVSWIEQQFGNGKDPYLSTAIFTVDAPVGSYVIPKNKGNEVMAYLSYIIGQYHNLSDITIFMHAHSVAWHNNELLHGVSSNMIRRLSSPTVVRNGYFNMRCHWNPGCPHHTHPLGDEKMNKDKPETEIFKKSWRELFPEAEVPNVLTQPCCSQFALSRERILALPRERYASLRQWLLDTELKDYLSGRVFEYLWQYIFTGVAEHCPAEHICYRDGYGICFGGQQQYQYYFDLKKERDGLQKEIERIGPGEAQKIAMGVDWSKAGYRYLEVSRRMRTVDEEMVGLRKEAVERGKSPKNRAMECGRRWRKGDGF
ncbi:hypothetical protein K469DRAFT_244038 [Zopfia rhizophila CBS 207.26]|uniref:Uncharacterized protein n=1 Tax=Zopfia rhizophila CBS 207.26 TaxID=1314779 RepID=A0A6A6ERL8_9PEZI|nr:hypothetical protein K469DRAFT_244038 [Zopfia rhizophila CBS 207.26]